MSNKAYEVEKPNKELKAEPRVPQPNIQNLKTVTPIQIGGQAEVRLPAHRKCQNILFVGDSIAGTIHRPTIETAVNADVNLVKAYSSIYEIHFSRPLTISIIILQPQDSVKWEFLVG